MASKLYEVLNDVNNNRTQIIGHLNRTGLELEPDTSFGTIAANISACLKPNNDAEIFPVPKLHTTDPNLDPDLWHEPEGWPNIREIYEQYDNIEYNEKTYTPIYIALFSTELDTTTFYTRPNYSVKLGEYCDRGKIQIGYTYPATGSSYRSQGKLVRTSDDATFQVASTWDSDLKDYSDREVTHTWDNSKDIILPDGTRLKYVVVYAQYDTSPTKPSFWGSFNNFTGVDLYEALTDCEGVTTKNVNTSGISEVNDGIRGVGFFKRMTYIPPRHEPKQRYWYSNNNLIFSDGVPEQLIIEQDPTYRWFGADKNILLYSFDIKYFKHNIVGYYGNTSSSNTANAPVNAGLLYLECPAVRTVSIPLLRYLYITPEHQLNVDAVSLYYIDQIRDTNLFPYIKILGGTSSLTHQFKPMSNTQLFSLDSLEGFSTDVRGAISSLSCRSIIFPKLTIVSRRDSLWYTGNADYMVPYEYLGFPELVQAPTEVWLPPARFIELPKLKDAAQVKVYTPTSYSYSSASRLVYLDVSGLETGDFNAGYSYGLEYIKFPDVITFGNIYLFNCSSLSKEFILNMFSKLGDVTAEDREYSITIPQYMKTYKAFTDEELSIATNKGWVIK